MKNKTKAVFNALADVFNPTIPAFIVGGACASLASIIFTCTLKAPYGGLFALTALGHPILFLISVLFGAVVGALILVVLKEEKN